MGTREFMAEGEHESNVLGLEGLPEWLEKRLPRAARWGRIKSRTQLRSAA